MDWKPAGRDALDYAVCGLPAIALIYAYNHFTRTDADFIDAIAQGAAAAALLAVINTAKLCLEDWRAERNPPKPVKMYITSTENPNARDCLAIIIYDDGSADFQEFARIDDARDWLREMGKAHNISVTAQQRKDNQRL